MDILFPAERHRRPRIPAAPTSGPPAPVPPLTGQASARAWLGTHRATLTAAARHAADYGWPGHAIRLAATLFRYLDSGGHCPDASAIHGSALDAARHAGDHHAEATALTNLAAADVWLSRYPSAASHFQQALALFRQTGNRAGEARVLTNLGLADYRQGRYQQATGQLQQALALYRQTGDRTGEAYSWKTWAASASSRAATNKPPAISPKPWSSSAKPATGSVKPAH